MRAIETLAELRHQVASARKRGERVGFVPTMGALHDGHAALMRVAHAQCDFVVASVFVNPTQFGEGEDFERYPRTPARDNELAESAGVDLLWLPQVSTLYPEGETTRVTIGAMGDRLCGAHRRGHFNGVATVVVKLLSAVQPDVLYLGEKDFQQKTILQRVIGELLLPVEVRVVPTVRDPDGLALSSRNRYLTPTERTAALQLARALDAAQQAADEGETSLGRIRARTEITLADHELVRPQYAEIVDPHTLEPADVFDRPLTVLVAAHIGDTRLIDNRTIEPVALPTPTTDDEPQSIDAPVTPPVTPAATAAATPIAAGTQMSLHQEDDQ